MKTGNFITKNITKADLKKFLHNNLNVLLCGKHGCGKTQRIMEVFDEEKLNWVYLSASTCDPYIDLIGIPSEDKDGKLKFVKPARINEELEAIMIDEANRADKAVTNALMELIQFKSINGVKFPKLKVVWAAINPPNEDDDDDEPEYNVHNLDPAQIDRFHVIVNIPNKPDSKYFNEKFGQKGEVAVQWWNKQPSKFKKEVSPRRLEYALSKIDNIPLNFVLPNTGNIKQLMFDLTTDPVKKLFNEVISNPSKEKVQEFCALGKTDKIKELCEHKNIYFYLDSIPADLFSQQYFNNEDIRIHSNIFYLAKFKNFGNRVKEIITAHQTHDKIQLLKEVEKIYTVAGLNWRINTQTKPSSNKSKSNGTQIHIGNLSFTSERDRVLKEFEEGGVFVNDTDLRNFLYNLKRYQTQSIRAKFRRKALKTVFETYSIDYIKNIVSSQRELRSIATIYNDIMGDSSLMSSGSIETYNMNSLIKKYKELEALNK